MQISGAGSDLLVIRRNRDTGEKSLDPLRWGLIMIPHWCDDPKGGRKEFEATVRIDTPVEFDYYRNGGILQTVLRKLLKA